jgi:hypothetical protein
MLDADLAIIYGVETRTLNQAVKRNLARFPDDFMFQLTTEEWKTLKTEIAGNDEAADLRSQAVTSSDAEPENEFVGGIATDLKAVNWGGRRYAPYAFTEHGAVMLSSILRSERAVKASIQVVRAFVRMRSLLLTQDELSLRLKRLEAGVDGNFQIVFDAINELMAEKAEREAPRRLIGFGREEE